MLFEAYGDVSDDPSALGPYVAALAAFRAMRDAGYGVDLDARPGSPHARVRVTGIGLDALNRLWARTILTIASRHDCFVNLRTRGDAVEIRFSAGA